MGIGARDFYMLCKSSTIELCLSPNYTVCVCAHVHVRAMCGSRVCRDMRVMEGEVDAECILRSLFILYYFIYRGRDSQFNPELDPLSPVR